VRRAATAAVTRPIRGRALVLALVAGATAGALPSAASADVLGRNPGRHVVGCIKVGVWYQSYSGGPRRVRVQLRRHGHVVRSRRLRAPVRDWKYWRWCPKKPGKYKVRYITPQGSFSYRVRVTRRKGH
jgi:hypothetical protein